MKPASQENPKSIFSYRRFWAHRLGPAPFLPMSREEMDELGWEVCDIILVTGDAYVDHPSFGMAIIGRLLESQGFRVGIIAQPRWNSLDDFKKLGRPALFFGVTAGNMDSMVNRYTADKKIRSDDAYSPGNQAGLRPDRASLVYSQKLREAYKKTPLVLGGIESSLRRLAHFDYWSEKVRRSILVDAKADLLLYGNAERAIVELAHRLAASEKIESITDLRGSCHLRPAEGSGEVAGLVLPVENGCLRLPAFEQLVSDKLLYALAAREAHLESNPLNARPLLQRYGDRDLVVNPPPWPLESKDLDKIYELPYQRRPHPFYADQKIPAYEMIRFSVNILRGCFGGCTFCSITAHEGRIIQSRSAESVLREIENIRDHTPGFSGHISDLGGPTANMYRLNCNDSQAHASCRKPSCIYPTICHRLETNHGSLVDLYRRARSLPGIKRVFIGSGVRYDLAMKSPDYIRELAQHHVGGYLKIAPEHLAEKTLQLMMKPPIELFDRFKELFEKYSAEARLEQYLIPYFIAAHPGTTDRDMLELALWLKKNDFRPDQVQTFLPSPMALATDMYYTGLNLLKRISRESEKIAVPAGLNVRRLHKAFLRYHDPANWAILREALFRLGRQDLVGSGKTCLVPAENSGLRKPPALKTDKKAKPRR